MRCLVIITFLTMIQPTWAACPIISIDPCRTIVHHVKKVKPTHKALTARVADLERRLLLAEAMLAGHEAALGAQQHQLSRLAPR